MRKNSLRTGVDLAMLGWGRCHIDGYVTRYYNEGSGG